MGIRDLLSSDFSIPMAGSLLVLLASGCGPAAFRITEGPSLSETKIFACPEGSSAECAQSSILQLGNGSSAVDTAGGTGGNVPVDTMGSSSNGGVPATGPGGASGNLPGAGEGGGSNSNLPAAGTGGSNAGLPASGTGGSGGTGGSNAGLPASGTGGSHAGLPTAGTGGSGGTGGLGGGWPVAGLGGGANQNLPSMGGHQTGTSLPSLGSRDGAHSGSESRPHHGDGWRNRDTATNSNSGGNGMPPGGQRPHGMNGGGGLDRGCIDPLVIHLSQDPNDRLLMSSADSGVFFDILGSKAQHVPKRTAWIMNPNYMFISLPKSGVVGGIDDLFGNNSVGPDGLVASDGFAALAKFDLNHDGVIDARDPVFSHLRLWSDRNIDGVSQPAELFTLQEMGIVRLDLSFDPSYSETDMYGNTAKLKSFGHGSQGKSYMLFDLWLTYK